MALTTTSSVYTYVSNGTQRVYTFPYPFTRRTDLRVTLIDDGVETDLILGAGYSVDPDGGASGTVTLTTAPAAGVLVRIRRVVALTQEASFPVQGPFSPEVVAKALDKLTMICQQLSEGLGTYVHGKEGGGDLHTLATDSEAGFIGPGDFTWMQGHKGSGASHTIDQIVGLREALDDLEEEILGRAPAAHGHTIESITGLREILDILELALEDKASEIHTHPWHVITDKPTEIGETGITDVYTKDEVDEEVKRLDKRIDGISAPYIGTNGNWWIGGTDTGTKASGEDGSDGTPGSVWHIGTGAPSGSLGAVGDFYLDQTTGDYYRKTGASTWTLQGTLKGDVGLPGSKWYASDGAPSGSIGVVGDFHLHSGTGDVREKTGTSTWTLRGNIRGPKGTDGKDGTSPHIGGNGNWWIGAVDTGVEAQGPKGDKGDPGGGGLWAYYTFDGTSYTRTYGASDLGEQLSPEDPGVFYLTWPIAPPVRSIVSVVPGPAYGGDSPLMVRVGEPEEGGQLIRLFNPETKEYVNAAHVAVMVGEE